VPDALLQWKVANERLTAERARTALLRRTLAEALIELEHARQHGADDASVTQLPTVRGSIRTRPSARP
jgi:hypothetical protein